MNPPTRFWARLLPLALLLTALAAPLRADDPAADAPSTPGARIVERLETLETPLLDVLQLVADKAGLKLDVSGIDAARLQQRVTAAIHNKPASDVLLAILRPFHLAAEIREGVVVVVEGEDNATFPGELPKELASKRVENLRFRETPLRDALSLLAVKSELDYIFVEEKFWREKLLTAEIKNATVDQILHSISISYEFSFATQDEILLFLKDKPALKFLENPLPDQHGLRRIENLRFRETPLQDALRLIDSKADINCLFDSSDPIFARTITAELQNISLENALGSILEVHDLKFLYQGHILNIIKKDNDTDSRNNSLITELPGPSAQKRIETLRFRETPLQDALRLIISKSDFNALFDGSEAVFHHKISGEFRDITLNQAWMAILESNDLSMALREDVIMIFKNKKSSNFTNKGFDKLPSQIANTKLKRVNFVETPIYEVIVSIASEAKVNLMIVSQNPRFKQPITYKGENVSVAKLLALCLPMDATVAIFDENNVFIVDNPDISTLEK
jgi:hypothetical protein